MYIDKYLKYRVIAFKSIFAQNGGFECYGSLGLHFTYLLNKQEFNCDVVAKSVLFTVEKDKNYVIK